MRLVIERVKSASLSVNNELVCKIGHGLLVFVGVCKKDTEAVIEKTAKKIATMRIFDKDGKLNDSVKDVQGEVLLVSNFTLCTVDTSGARPDFGESADRTIALELYNSLADKLNAIGVQTKKGVFGADMQIETHLDGPITIYKDIKNKEI